MPAAILTASRSHVAGALRAVLPYASDDTTRPHMCSVLIELWRDEGAMMFVATDGHSLAVATIPCQIDQRDTLPAWSAWLLDAGDAAALAKAVHGRTKGERAAPVLLGLGVDDQIRATLPGAVHTYTLRVDGDAITFPAWRQVVPPLLDDDADKRPAPAVGMDPDLLARMSNSAAVFRTACDESITPAVLRVGDTATQPIRLDWQAAHDPQARLLVIGMPCRAKREDGTYDRAAFATRC